MSRSDSRDFLGFGMTEKTSKSHCRGGCSELASGAPRKLNATRKNIRLSPEHYRTGEPFFLTICTKNKQSILTGESVISILTDFLETQTTSQNGPVHAYIVMPDHLHMIVATEKDIVQWVAWFKARLTFFLKKQGVSESIWQKSFHDHGIRKSENIEEILAYMRANPFKAGLIENDEDWPWRYGC